MVACPPFNLWNSSEREIASEPVHGLIPIGSLPRVRVLGQRFEMSFLIRHLSLKSVFGANENRKGNNKISASISSVRGLQMETMKGFRLKRACVLKVMRKCSTGQQAPRFLRLPPCKREGSNVISNIQQDPRAFFYFYKSR